MLTLELGVASDPSVSTSSEVRQSTGRQPIGAPATSRENHFPPRQLRDEQQLISFAVTYFLTFLSLHEKQI